ncbi:MAG: acyl-[acyl-carrier-protein]--UDP-N-acetylglucosam ine O-acyltransferase [Micavibrio sp.]|nr:MAG: acyl-[acyl-carrier-protein]--UDP-N-acetylglucosam ine O-acyltransferase [Micavibrio sp.]
MSQNIHPTAVIEDGAQLGSDVSIGPYCVVGPHASLGDNVTLKAHVVIDGHTAIGEGTTIYSFASIGSAPQDLKYRGEPSELIIGKNNTIREHVTINPGTESGGMKTIIGDNCLLMVGAHVAHDCILGNNVIMANNATLGGHVSVGDHALLGGLSAVHQFVRIGAFAVIGGLSGIADDVIPYGRAKGEKAYLSGLNLVGLERANFSKEQIRKLQKAFNQLFDSADGNFSQRLEAVSSEYADDPAIMEIIRFADEENKFGLCQPRKKAA